MARFGAAIDTNEIERTSGSFDLLPFGDYILELTAIEEKSIGGGDAHSYTYEVIEPEEYAKRRIWDTIMVDHPDNIGWVKASMSRLAKLADSVGFDPETEGEIDPLDGKKKLADDEVLMYRRFLGKVVQREGGPDGSGGKYKDSNEVVDFYNRADPKCPSGPSIYPVQPAMLPPRKKKGAATPKPANDNRQPAANDNKAAPAQAKKTPW